MTLVWGGILNMRANGYFDEALGAGKMLGYGTGRLTESDFIRAFSVSGVYTTVHDASAYPPGWAHDDVPLLFDVLEFLYQEATPARTTETSFAAV